VNRAISIVFLILLVFAASPAAATVVAVSVDNVVHPITLEILKNTFEQAEADDADLILLRLNTPGGLLEATREITELIVGSDIPVVTYVTPSGGRAASAGFFILQAGDVAAMAPGTRTGAASPVLMGQQMDPVMRRKIESDTSAALRSVVEKRGRNAELAQKAVIEAKAFTETEALENNLIDLIAASETELLEKINHTEITRFDGSVETLDLASTAVVDYELSTRERFIKAIANPNIAFIILVIGALGVYIEFSSPGLILPGVAGGILVLLGLSALSVLPISWLGAALLVLAVALFILEASFASHGILGAGGAVAMVLGAILLVEGPPELRISLGTAIGVTLPFALITLFLLTLVIRARSNKVVTGRAGMIGEVGEAHTDLDPAGRVFVHGEFWEAVATTPVAAGSRVRIMEVDGLRLKVEAASTEGEFNA
jgi:membrane-bound serine protease (ClpP class)